MEKLYTVKISLGDKEFVVEVKFIYGNLKVFKPVAGKGWSSNEEKNVVRDVLISVGKHDPVARLVLEKINDYKIKVDEIGG